MHTVVGLLIGVAGWLAISTYYYQIGSAFHGSLGYQWVPYAQWTCVGIFVLLGYITGQGKAYWLRLQAQMALCQVQIEHNTRQTWASLATVQGLFVEYLRSIHHMNIKLYDHGPEVLPANVAVVDRGWTCECGQFNEQALPNCGKCGRAFDVSK